MVKHMANFNDVLLLICSTFCIDDFPWNYIYMGTYIGIHKSRAKRKERKKKGCLVLAETMRGYFGGGGGYKQSSRRSMVWF